MAKGKADIPYEQSYLGQLRPLIGQRRMIIVTVRAVIQDAQGQILLIRRSDNDQWGMPAGSLELDETILEGVAREVSEETGLTVKAATLFAVNSGPNFNITTAYGDPYQLVTFAFRIDEWAGELITATDETRDAQFFARDALPANLPDLYHQTLGALQAYQGHVIFLI